MFFRGKTTEDFPLRDTVGKNATIVKFCGVLGVDLKCLKVISPKFEKSAFRGQSDSPPTFRAGKNLIVQEKTQ